MLRHHIPQIVSHAGSTGRYFLSYVHTFARTLVVALSRFESPREALRTARQEPGRPGLADGIARGALRGKPLLIHYHIFKNAGSSFEWALEKAVGKGLQRYDSLSHDGFLTRSDLAAYVKKNVRTRIIATHQAAPPAPRIKGRRVLSSILIRDPIARVRSIYAFERSQVADNPGAIKAKELGFKGYVEWRMAVSPRMFCNFQIHFCCRDRAKADPPLDRSHLDRAIAALDGMDIVGTVERYDEWLALAQSILSEHFGFISLASVRENQSTSGKPQSESEIKERLVEELGSDLAGELLVQNELDMCLHQVADALLTRRLAERSVLIRLRDAYGRAPQAQAAASET
ncbi:MAG: hypothetical protein H0X34_03895 [Chthoniobacterales bacterium]|jgi:hypothetical protein|nr:hypothetical protein [Chthoniobacterales bacterium]